MKKQITYLITVLLATVAVSSAAPPDKTTMQGKEKAAWQAFKDKNEADFKKVVDKDFRGVYDGGISNMQQAIGRHEKVGHEVVRDQ